VEVDLEMKAKALEIRGAVLEGDRWRPNNRTAFLSATAQRLGRTNGNSCFASSE